LLDESENEDADSEIATEAMGQYGEEVIAMLESLLADAGGDEETEGE